MIYAFLTQAAWRIRAYLATQPDLHSVGWRRDPSICPIAEWLLFETARHWHDEDCSQALDAPISVDGDEIRWGNVVIVTPMVLAHFVQIIDDQEGACFFGESTLVSRAESLAALLQAEHQAAQRLLPEHAESRARCDFWRDGQQCTRSAETPCIYAFLDMRDGTRQDGAEKLRRSDCRLFIGQLCWQHWLQVVTPPSAWWPQETASVETPFLESVEV